MHILLPDKVKYIIDTIEEAGFEAYAVGGCIRDSILLREPEDWDITTSATPEDIKKLFRRTVDTGIAHGTVTVMLDKEGFEVTTYRIDGTYEDSRHPSFVTFTPNLKEDLKRRDFTINAMAYNEKAGLIDLFGGMEDIGLGRIRCVGNALERFDEDALRIMRAIRFAAQLDYQIDENTKAAISHLASTLQKISAERIQIELVKLLISDHPDYIRLANELGVTAIILPEWHHQDGNVSKKEHAIQSMKYVDNRKELRLAMLFHHLSVEIVEHIFKRLKFDRSTTDMVVKLVRFHDYGRDMTLTQSLVRHAVHGCGEDIFPAIFDIQMADIKAQNQDTCQKELSHITHFKQLYQEIIAQKDCLSLKDLAVTGADLIDLGMKPGKEIGMTLNQLLDIVLDDPALNTKDYLLNYVR